MDFISNALAFILGAIAPIWETWGPSITVFASGAFGIVLATTWLERTIKSVLLDDIRAIQGELRQIRERTDAIERKVDVLMRLK